MAVLAVDLGAFIDPGSIKAEANWVAGRSLIGALLGLSMIGLVLVLVTFPRRGRAK